MRRRFCAMLAVAFVALFITDTCAQKYRASKSGVPKPTNKKSVSASPKVADKGSRASAGAKKEIINGTAYLREDFRTKLGTFSILHTIPAGASYHNVKDLTNSKYNWNEYYNIRTPGKTIVPYTSLPHQGEEAWFVDILERNDTVYLITRGDVLAYDADQDAFKVALDATRLEAHIMGKLFKDVYCANDLNHRHFSGVLDFDTDQPRLIPYTGKWFKTTAEKGSSSKDGFVLHANDLGTDWIGGGKHPTFDVSFDSSTKTFNGPLVAKLDTKWGIFYPVYEYWPHARGDKCKFGIKGIFKYDAAKPWEFILARSVYAPGDGQMESWQEEDDCIAMTMQACVIRFYPNEKGSASLKREPLPQQVTSSR